MSTDAVRDLLRSDLFVYAGSGIFAILVFVLALGALDRYGPAGVGGGELSGLVIGFAAFMAVYFLALGVWYYLKR